MADDIEIPSDFPFDSNYVDVLGSPMHYVDVGEGDPVLFLHGNPTSSYLWRNIIPHLSGQARCVAPDLIGMGKSGHPDIAYRYDEHYRYISAFIDKLDIGSNLTLVIHDWGSGLGFRWAHDHEDRVKAIAFMEAIIGSMTWEEMPKDFRNAFRMMRTPGIGWAMISGANMFVKRMLPDATHRDLDDDAMAYYASAFPTVGSRKAVRQWPREVPISGKPADNVAVIEAYRRWLTETDIPKLLFYCHPGAIIVDIGDGIHFVQEDNPDKIGTELSKWYAAL